MNRHLIVAALAGLFLGSVPGSAAGQVIRGVVLQDGTDRPIPAAVLRLLDGDGDSHGVAISDSAGAYALPVDAPGDYRIATEAYGYRPLVSHLLAVRQQEAYAVDVLLTLAPIGLPGLEITADRYAEIERGLRLVIGVSPRSLRNAPILRPTIEDHLARSHDVADMMRWSGLPSITTRETADGTCFQWRARHCLPVYLNGARLSQEVVPMLPLEVIDMIVVMTPNESAAYAGGAVLLYTPGYIG